MKYGDNRLELTRRNLDTLLLKLEDPLSARTLSKDGFAVTAVESEGPTPTRDRLWLTRGDIEFLLGGGALLAPEGLEVVFVENDEHYSDREPGVVYMPSTGEYI